MNKVFKSVTSNIPLTLDELKLEAGFKDRHGNLFDYDEKNLVGNMCDCYGDGEFVLLPKNDPAVIEGGKRYMKCRKCGGYSHL